MYFILQDDAGNYVSTNFAYNCLAMGDDPHTQSWITGDINLAFRFASHDDAIKHKYVLGYSEQKEYKIFRVNCVTITIGEVNGN